MSQDSNSNEKRYFKIQDEVMEQSKCVHNLLFPSFDKCYIRILVNNIERELNYGCHIYGTISITKQT